MNVTEQPPTRQTVGTSNSKKPAAGRTGARFGWLDALRGIAALVVACYHFNVPFLIPYGTWVGDRFDYGIFAVVLFFLVSGYIVPASLERRGDVRGFWVGRLFRIYPVLIVIIVASLAVLPRAYAAVQGYAFDHSLLATAANGLMLHEMLAVPSVLGVMWTLSYEMVFYYFVSALFVLGWHRKSTSIAIGFATVALLLGAAIAPTMISVDELSTRHLVLGAGVVVVMGMACVLSGNDALTRTGALLLGGLGLLLAFTNARATVFETMMIFATMFCGTVLYRVQHGQIERLHAVMACGFVMVAGFLVGVMYNNGSALWRTWTVSWMAWSYAYVGAWAVFLLGMALRNRRFPRVLTWLGTVSYSVYLVHIPVIHAMAWLLKDQQFPKHGFGKFIPTAIFLTSVLVLSYLTHRFLELPGQKLGNRLLKALSARTARSRAAVGAAAEEPAQALAPREEQVPARAQ
ncbi:acyltransferase family protein [Kitasatospora sp. NPDC050543]|uniref:acyltransferase family protein n=1 Tax=Kitasatospora sp. NPDC050543 TaxID=3364054 RepID=UPI0037A324E3